MNRPIDALMDYLDKEPKDRKKLLKWAKAIASVGALGLAYGAVADSGLNLLGDMGRSRSTAELTALAQAKARTQFQAASTAGKFSMMYLHQDANGYPRSLSIGLGDGGKGILGAFTRDKGSKGFYFGQHCLSGTAFDTQPSEIVGRSSGQISASAAINVLGDTLKVYPVASNAEPLTFVVSDTGLTPSDVYTTSTLDAYGCKPEITKYDTPLEYDIS